MGRRPVFGGLARFLSAAGPDAPTNVEDTKQVVEDLLPTDRTSCPPTDKDADASSSSTSSSSDSSDSDDENAAENATERTDKDEEASQPLTSTLKRRSPDYDLALSSETSSRSIKKRKVGLLDAGLERYDASALVPFYTEQSQVPEALHKYFSQRHRYFSLYSSGCLLDDVGWYSVTPERIADQIADRCRCDVVLDAFCGVGGNAIAFAKTCERVIAMDTSPTRLALARHNAALYGVVDRIDFVLGDYLQFARAYSPGKRKIDVVFLSPPWGGPEYLAGSPAKPTSEEEHPEYSLASIQPVHGAELFRLTRRITPNVAYFLPRNTSPVELGRLVEGDGEGTREMVEIEEEWMGNKLKALTAYFGGLAAGQEHMF